jgi:uncharacterized protein YcfJ
MNTSQRNLLIGTAVVVALASTAVASTYFSRQSTGPEAEQPIVEKQVTRTPRAAAPAQHTAAAPQAQPCDDNNIVGTVGGAVAGGLIGSQFGKGDGRGLATAGGVVAGGALGNAYIPTRGATCN